MNYDHWKCPSDGGISYAAQEDEARERADEIADAEAREARWSAFMARAGELGERRGFPRLLQDVTAVLRRGHPAESQLVELWLADFAESDGWDGVLHGIALAMSRVGRVA